MTTTTTTIIVEMFRMIVLLLLLNMEKNVPRIYNRQINKQRTYRDLYQDLSDLWDLLDH